ncbi:hypothetical protein L596_017618 [Steinernema carpocapsae]|uniref:Uncharacterized protein n=1 Tax=Steinernema carpocapsae TaxID=34508 RepID=A0A4U5N2K0_STECR|nr:hypothetical protein L596_017618 [Steinernema carpocapsae]
MQVSQQYKRQKKSKTSTLIVKSPSKEHSVTEHYSRSFQKFNMTRVLLVTKGATRSMITKVHDYISMTAFSKP